MRHRAVVDGIAQATLAVSAVSALFSPITTEVAFPNTVGRFDTIDTISRALTPRHSGRHLHSYGVLSCCFSDAIDLAMRFRCDIIR